MLAINFNPFPDLFTDRLHLRRIQKEDTYNFFLLRSDPEVLKYLDRPALQSMNDAEVFLEKINTSLINNEGINWAVSLKDDPSLIGTIAFWRIDKENHRAEIGYMLYPSMQKKGIMNEALQSVLQFGFTEMKLHSVEANVNPENNASIGLLEKNGFIREAYFKENYFFDGKFLDSVIYSLLTPNT